MCACRFVRRSVMASISVEDPADQQKNKPSSKSSKLLFTFVYIFTVLAAICKPVSSATCLRTSQKKIQSTYNSEACTQLWRMLVFVQCLLEINAVFLFSVSLSIAHFGSCFVRVVPRLLRQAAPSNSKNCRHGSRSSRPARYCPRSSSSASRSYRSALVCSCPRPRLI